MAGDGLNQFGDAAPFGRDRLLNGRNPHLLVDRQVHRHRHVLPVVTKDTLGRVSQLQRGLECPFGVFDPGTVSLVDHQNIGDLQDARLDGLDVVTQAGRLHHQGGMRQARNVHFALTRAHGLD